MAEFDSISPMIYFFIFPLVDFHLLGNILWVCELLHLNSELIGLHLLY